MNRMMCLAENTDLQLSPSVKIPIVFFKILGVLLIWV